MSNNNNKIENFFAQISTFPLNTEIGILQIGHQADFITDCTYLQMAKAYFDKIGAQQEIKRENYREFSEYVNAAMDDGKKRIQKARECFNDAVEAQQFKDVGDINSVQLPVCSINRFDDTNKLQEKINYYESKIDMTQEVKEQLEKLTKKEIEKDEYLKDYLIKQCGEEFYNDMVKPKDLYNYCRLRATCAYYYNAVTGKIDEDKESLKTDFYFMSYFNFIYPNGKIEEYKDTKFKDIKEICDYMTNSQKAKLLEKFQIDEKMLNEKVKEEENEEKLTGT